MESERSTLLNYVRTTLMNNGTQKKNITLHLVLNRNPVPERKGEHELKKIQSVNNNWIKTNDKLSLYSVTSFDQPNTSKSQPDLQDWAEYKTMKKSQTITDEKGYAKGSVVYHLILKPGESKEYDFIVPALRKGKVTESSIRDCNFDNDLKKTIDYWENRVPVKLSLPDKMYEDVFYTSIYYSLLLMENTLLFPGPSVYNHFFLHDAVEMAEALDKAGLKIVARDAIKDFNYTNSQYLDELGGNIYAIYSHYKLNQDIDWLKQQYPKMLEKCNMVKEKRKQQLKSGFRNTVFYGLMPKSVSQDNFTIPAYLYVDNWWALCALKEAMDAAQTLNKTADYKWLKSEYQGLLKCLLESMEITKQREGLDQYPGFADDWPEKYRKVDQLYRILGETQKAWAHRPALYPGQSLGIKIPIEEFKKSYNSYWDIAGKFSDYDGGWFVEYENLFWGYNLKLAHPLMYVDMEDVALKNLSWSLKHQSCPGAWMEAIPCKTTKKGLKKVDPDGGIVGDVPHGWVASHYILLVRDMLIREEPDRLILLSCIPEAWYGNGKIIAIENAPTFFGKVSFKMESYLDKGYLLLNIDSENNPKKGYKIIISLKQKIKKVEIDNKEWDKFSGNEIDLPPITKQVKIIVGATGRSTRPYVG